MGCLGFELEGGFPYLLSISSIPGDLYISSRVELCRRGEGPLNNLEISRY